MANIRYRRKSIERSGERMDGLFPFPKIRDGQKEMLEDVQEVVKSGGILIAHAPTGIGKTAAAIAPSLEYAIKNDKIVFFLTSKQSHHKIVVNTLKAIKNKKEVIFTAVDVISKQAMCPRSIAKEHYALFNELCKLEQKTGACKYARKYNKGVVRHIRENILHVEELKDICTSNGVCPHKTALKASAKAQVLICDYNYVFSDILETILDKTKHSLNDIILIIDEAHNLPRRIQDNSSYELTLNALKEAAQEIKATDVKNKIIHNYLTGIARFFNKFAKDRPQEVEQNIKREVIVDGINKVLSASLEPINYVVFVQMLKSASTEMVENNENKTSYLMNVAKFLAGWNSDLPASRVFSNSPPKISLKLLDPSIISRDIIAKVHATIMMSGTLYPMEMYADILGVDREKTILREYKSPFPKENRLIVVTKGLTTLYKMRSITMYQNMAGKIAKIATVVENTVQGNVAVFYPSYAFLNSVVKYFPKEMNRGILIERRDMNKRQKNQLYTELRGGSGKVLMGVQAGSLSEGMDYENNMLKAVIIVGLPLSPPTLDVKNLKKYYEEKFGREKGILYGYTYPAIRKVLQAAGRCIRSETDIGAIILMDYRFSMPGYMKFLPLDYEIKVVKAPEKICEEFFRSDVVVKALKEAKKRTKGKEIEQERISGEKDNLPLAIFSLIKNLNFHIGRLLLASILVGSKLKRLSNQGLNRSKYYGMFKEYRHKDMINQIDQLINRGYLTIKQSESTKFPRPLLYLTDLSKSALISKEKIKTTKSYSKVLKIPLKRVDFPLSKFKDDEKAKAYAKKHDGHSEGRYQDGRGEGWMLFLPKDSN